MRGPTSEVYPFEATTTRSAAMPLERCRVGRVRRWKEYKVEKHREGAIESSQSSEA